MATVLILTVAFRKKLQLLHYFHYYSILSFCFPDSHCVSQIELFLYYYDSKLSFYYQGNHLGFQTVLFFSSSYFP